MDIDSLFKGFIFVTTGRVVRAFSGWLVAIVLAQNYGAEILGIYGLSLAATSPVFGFFGLNLRNLFVTDPSSDLRVSRYLSLRLVSASIALVVCLSIAIALGISSLKGLAIAIIALTKAVDLCGELCQGIVQKREGFGWLSVFQNALGVLTIVAVCGLAWFDQSFLSLLVAMLIVRGVVLVGEFRIAKNFSREILFERGWFTLDSGFRALLLTSLPLGLMIGLVSLNSMVPRYALEAYVGTESVGYLTAIGYFMVAGSTVAGAYQAVVSPRMTLFWAERNRAFMPLLTQALLVVALGAALFALVIRAYGAGILEVAYGEGYAHLASELLLLTVAGGCMYLAGLVASVLMIQRRTRMLAVCAFLSLSSNCIAALLLVPTYGVYGASLSILCSSATFLIVSAISVAPSIYHFATSMNQTDA